MIYPDKYKDLKFVGAEKYKLCHSIEYRKWQNTKHAKAYEDMEKHYEIRTTDKEGRIHIYEWVNKVPLNGKDNVKTLVRGGRCRWKIENECFNTLKNQGYHIEHNYGHGEKNLCFNFFLLTLLAFYFHQIFELTDNVYQSCRKKFGSKQHMWETLRAYIKILVFSTWEHLMDFSLTPTKYKVKMQSP